jgi:hypothetical protein
VQGPFGCCTVKGDDGVSNIDKRNKLGEEPFTYQTTKKGTVEIYYKGKQIKVIKGREAERILAKIQGLEDNITEVQLLLAKITGNFKRGTEKISKNKGK